MKKSVRNLKLLIEPKTFIRLILRRVKKSNLMASLFFKKQWDAYQRKKTGRQILKNAFDAVEERRWKTARSLYLQLQDHYPEVDLDENMLRLVEERILASKELSKGANDALESRRWRTALSYLCEIQDQYPEMPHEQPKMISEKIKVAEEKISDSGLLKDELEIAVKKKWWTESRSILEELEEYYPDETPDKDTILLINESSLTENSLFELKDRLGTDDNFPFKKTWEEIHARNEQSAQRRTTQVIPNPSVPLRILFAAKGHQDFLFVAPIIERLKLVSDIETRTLDISVLYNPPVSKTLKGMTAYASELVGWADVVFVEWATAEAAWFVDLIPESKKIVVRLHSYELLNPYPLLFDWGKVDDLICVSKHNLARVSEVLHPQSYGCKTHVLGNLLEVSQYLKPKKSSASKTLGLVGYGRRVKRPDLALDLLAELLKNDEAWKLSLVGAEPSHRLEKSYFEDFFVRATPYIEQGKIVINSWTDSLSSWLQDIGVILSCSDREGTHEACREGISSGSIGVIRQWPWSRNYGGNKDLFPDSYHWNDVSEAAKYLESFTSSEDIQKQGEREQKVFLERENPDVLLGRFLKIVSI